VCTQSCNLPEVHHPILQMKKRDSTRVRVSPVHPGRQGHSQVANPSLSHASTEKLLEQKSSASWDRKETEQDFLVQLWHALTLDHHPKMPCLELVPIRVGQARGTAHRQMTTLAEAGQPLVEPSPVLPRAEEQRAFMRYNPG
jgi:hypothetical protein